MFKDWGSLLARSVSERLDIDLTPEQIEQFCRYGDLLLEWNEKMNLTAITEPGEVVIKHFVDSLAFRRPVPNSALSGRLVDIGTGAGFPGIPLKIICPQLDMTLVDSLAKKLNFLENVITELGLTGIKTLHIRAEEIGRNPDYRENCDIVTARAVARLPVLLEYALPVLKVGGLFLAGKGIQVDEEIQEASRAIETLGGRLERVERICLNEQAVHRAVVVVKKIKSTGREYPRRVGVPEKKPL